MLIGPEVLLAFNQTSPQIVYVVRKVNEGRVLRE
jgi:hypothetical protein